MTRAEKLYRELIATADAWQKASDDPERPYGDRSEKAAIASAYRAAANRARVVLCIPVTIDGDEIKVGKPT